MVKLLGAVLAGIFLSGAVAFAKDIEVQASQEEYTTSIIAANNAEGVSVMLSKEVMRDDCNQRTMDMTSALVSGDGKGWYDKYFLDAYISQTKIFCPLDSPVKETIYSRPIFIKSFSNENMHGEVRVSLVIPRGYKLEVAEVASGVVPGAETAADTASVISPEEYEAYAAVFASEKLDGIPFRYVVLEKDTKKETVNKENWKDIDGFLVDDFNRKNEQQYALEDKFPEDATREDHGRLQIKIREQKEERTSPFDTGRTSVSRVGFNRDKTEALVYVQHVATPESGIGYFVFLHRDNGKWTISGSIVGKIF